ncbi:formin-2 [Osmerus eperlanus]|uniref:formin-2 n=1 Tax=Osmerus eperlanus TaxID=29151 RepID=UPI002E0D25E7
MKLLVFLLGLLITCHTAPVEDEHRREARSASDEEVENLRLMLTEMKQTLAKANQLPPAQPAAPPKAPGIVVHSIPASGPKPEQNSLPQINLYLSAPVQSSVPQNEPPKQPPNQEVFLATPVTIQGIPFTPNTLPQRGTPFGPFLQHGMPLPGPQKPMAFPMPQPGMGFPMPQPGMAFPMPQPGMGFPMPQQGMAFPMPQQGMALPMPQPGMGFPMPQPGMGFPMPQPGMGFPMPQPGMGFPMPQPGMGYPMPQQGVVFSFGQQELPPPGTQQAVPQFPPASNPQGISYIALVPQDGASYGSQPQGQTKSLYMPLPPQMPSFNPYGGLGGRPTFGISPPIIFRERSQGSNIQVPAGIEHIEDKEPEHVEPEQEVVKQVAV